MYKVVAIVSITISLLSSFRTSPIQNNIDQAKALTNINATDHRHTHSHLNDDPNLGNRSFILKLNEISADCDKEEQHLPSKTITCLDHCAHCVKQWKNGFYNGPKCAKDCVSHHQDPVGYVDLDCNSEIYLNLELAVNL